MKKISSLIATIAMSVLTVVCFAQPKGLKDYYKNYFAVGVAVAPSTIGRVEESSLVLREFNSMTPENAMKMGPIHPEENRYDWIGPDSIARFAKRNNLKLRGHTLVWHNQLPPWIFKDENGTVSKEVLLARLRSHISTVVGRYKGTIYAWDVVNEVISDREDEYLRPSPWVEICGEEFIRKAFEYAHEADPDALLFYNDYNEINPIKRAKIIKLVTSLKSQGVPIHGIGLQAHWAVNEPTRDQLEATLSDLSKTGLSLQITELDISVYPKEHNARERKAEDSDTRYTPEKQKQQEAIYAMCFELFRKYKKNITGVTFWNLSDKHSWLDNFPVKGRKDYPLLFDQELKPKTSYKKITSF